MLVRIKPYNPQQGCKLQRLCLSASPFNGKIYEEGKWYEENDPSILEALGQVNQDATMSSVQKNSIPRAFDIMTEEEQEELQAEEAKARMGYDRRVHVAQDRTVRSDEPVMKPRVGQKPGRVGQKKAS